MARLLSPLVANCMSPPLAVDQCLVRRSPPRVRASRMRKDSPSVTTTMLWCRRRPRRLTAVVCSGRNRPQDSKGPCADAEGAAFVGGGDEPEQRTDDRHGRVACEKRSGVEHLGAGALQRLRPPPRVSGDPRQSRHHVEPRALGDEQHLGCARSARLRRLRVPRLPVGRTLGDSRHGQGEAIGHLPQDYRPHRQPGDDALRAGHDVTSRLLVDADRRLRGDVAARVAAQVLERPQDDVRKLDDGQAEVGAHPPDATRPRTPVIVGSRWL